jgi:hypothetical protein
MSRISGIAAHRGCGETATGICRHKLADIGTGRRRRLARPPSEPQHALCQWCGIRDNRFTKVSGKAVPAIQQIRCNVRADGPLTALSPATVWTGSTPVSIAITTVRPRHGVLRRPVESHVGCSLAGGHPSFLLASWLVLEPRNTEQNDADSGEKDTSDQANRHEHWGIVSTLVGHEGPRSCIKHEATKSGSNRGFEATRLGRQFSRQVRQRLSPHEHGGRTGFVVGRFWWHGKLA